MIPGATGHLAEPLDENGLPKLAVLLLGLDVDHETGERFAAVAVENDKWHAQLRPKEQKHYRARWVTRWRWARVPLSDIVFDNPEPSYTARSQAVAALVLSLGLDHMAGGPWTSDDRLLLGAALAMTSGVQVADSSEAPATNRPGVPAGPMASEGEADDDVPSVAELRDGLERAVGA